MALFRGSTPWNCPVDTQVWLAYAGRKTTRHFVPLCDCLGNSGTEFRGGNSAGIPRDMCPGTPHPRRRPLPGEQLAACGGASCSVMTCKYPSQAYSRVCPQSLYPCGIRGRGLYLGVYRGSSMLWLGLQIRCPERNIGMDTGIPRCCLYRTTLAVGPSGNSTTNIRMECVGNPKSSLHCSIPP